MKVRCKACDGAGIFGKWRCARCDGSGFEAPAEWMLTTRERVFIASVCLPGLIGWGLVLWWLVRGFIGKGWL